MQTNRASISLTSPMSLASVAVDTCGDDIPAADLVPKPIPPAPASLNSHQKKSLTKVEKAQIYRFHKDYPLVTHSDIAGRYT